MSESLRNELEILLANLDTNNVDLAVDAIERLIDLRVSAAIRRHLEKFHGFIGAAEPPGGE